MTVVGSTRVERMEGTCAGGKSVLTCLRATFVKESRSYDGERKRETSKVFESEKDARRIKFENCRGALRIVPLHQRTKLRLFYVESIF